MIWWLMALTLAFAVQSLALEKWAKRAKHYEKLWRQGLPSNAHELVDHSLMDATRTDRQRLSSSLSLMTRERDMWRDAWKTRAKTLPDELTRLLEKGELE